MFHVITGAPESTARDGLVLARVLAVARVPNGQIRNLPIRADPRRPDGGPPRELSQPIVEVFFQKNQPGCAAAAVVDRAKSIGPPERRERSRPPSPQGINAAKPISQPNSPRSQAISAIPPINPNPLTAPDQRKQVSARN
jgi:hypothetical protein